MKKRVFHLELISPMAMGGAETRKRDTCAEWGLRPPSIKGIMRYWFRALAGGVMGTTVENVKRLLEWEKAIFGSTERGSTFRIRVADWESERGNFEGNTYATFAFRRAERGSGAEPGPPAEGFFPPGGVGIEIQYGSSFVTNGVALTNGPRVDFESVDFMVCASLYCAVLLGGFGSRSRRGLGSFAFGLDSDFSDIEGIGHHLSEDRSELDIDAYSRQISESLGIIRRRFREIMEVVDGGTEIEFPSFHVLHPNFATIFVKMMPPGPSDETMCNELVGLYKTTRSHYAWQSKGFEFAEYEFIEGFTVNDLCAGVDSLGLGGIGMRFSKPSNTVGRLNEVLEIPNLYGIVMTQRPGTRINSNISSLVRETEQLRDRPFSSMRREEKTKIKRLNRMLLGSLFRRACPRILRGRGVSNRSMNPSLSGDNQIAYDTATNSYTGTEIMYKPAFGLPLPYTFRHDKDHIPGRGQIRAGATIVSFSLIACAGDKKINRRGSPVYLSFDKRGNNLYGTAVIFRSRFAGLHNDVRICRVETDNNHNEVLHNIGPAPYADNERELNQIMDPLCQSFAGACWKAVSL